MLITYFDEVKFEPGKQPYYWLGALTVSAAAIRRLEQQVSELSKECFRNAALGKDTEFHACDVFHRKHNFKKWNDLAKRLEVLQRLATILDSETELAKIYVRLDPSNMLSTDDMEGKAFMFLVERVESYLRAKQAPGILIGDRESETVANVFTENLSRYRRDGTSYYFGVELRQLIDTVHFTSSHHSRMLQLADLYVWLLQLCRAGDQGKHARRYLIDYVSKQTKLRAPTKYKEWPTEQSPLSPARAKTISRMQYSE